MKRDKFGKFVKGHIPWNIGLTKETDEKVKRVAKMKVGKKRPDMIGNQFRKGYPAPPKAFKKGSQIGRETRFKKGQKAWNEGLTKEIDKRLKELGKKASKTKKRLFKEGKLKIWSEGKKIGPQSKEIIKKRILKNTGKKRTEETKRKMRKARARQILPTKDTKIELKIQNFLKTLGMEFFTHQYMNIEHAYQCDILIPSMNLVIECDGVYWHKYPIGLDIDHIRNSELIKKGFKVLRLWEFEIKEMDINDFKDKLENETN